MREETEGTKEEKVSTAEALPTWAERFMFTAFLLFEGILRMFPMAFWCLFGRTVGLIGYYILPRYRRRIRHNLRIILGKQGAKEDLDRLAKENFKTLLCNFIAAAKAATMSDKALSRHYVIKGREHIMNSLKENGKGVICAISHMGNWELLARVRIRFSDVKRYGSMYRELDNSLIEQYWLERRQKSGCEMFGKKKTSFSSSTQILRDNGMLGILCDQNAGQYGVLVPYFGKRTSTTNLPALLQRRTGATLHTTTVRTIGLGKWEIAFGPAIEVENNGRDMAATTAKINYELSRIGRQSVVDGFWLHNRWKLEAFTLSYTTETPSSKNQEEESHPLRLLLVVPERLAEGLILIPFIRQCCVYRHDCEWSVLCPPSQKDFWQQCEEIQNVLVTGKNRNAQLRALDESSVTGLDAAFIFHPDKSVVSVLRKIGAIELRSIAGDNAALSGWRCATDPGELASSRGHRMDRLISVAKIWGMDLEKLDYLPHLRKRKSGGDDVVYFAPFSEYAAGAGWMPRDWGELAVLLPYTCRVLAFPENVAEAEFLAGELGLPLDICEVGQVMPILRQARLLIGVDGVLPGIAALCGTPTVTLFTHRLPEEWAPLGEGVKCLYEKDSLANLSPAQVMEIAINHLSSLGWNHDVNQDLVSRDA